MHTRLALIGSLIIFNCAAANSFAQGAFQNGAFDSPGLPVGRLGGELFLLNSTFITGWTTVAGIDGTYSGTVQYLRDTSSPVGGHRSQDPGGYFVELGYYFGMNGIRQTFRTAPEQLYLVTFWLATEPFNGPAGRLRVSSGDSTASYAALPSVGELMQWRQQSFSFISDASGLSTLTFQNVAGTIPAIDTIVVVTVPEPGVCGLVALGGTALGFLWGRRYSFCI